MVAIKPFDDGKFAAKVIALTKYDRSILTNVHRGKNRSMIEAGAAKLLLRYFEFYVDARARSNPSMLHHVYEFDMTGKMEARLFRGKVSESPVGAIISFSFKTSKVPNRFGYMFYSKAQIMEDGTTVIIKPKNSKYLQYRLKNGRFIKTQKPSVVPKPGGEVKNNFRNEFDQFTAIQVNKVLADVRFFERINDKIAESRDRIVPRINSSTLSNFAAQAALDATVIAMGASKENGSRLH